MMVSETSSCKCDGAVVVGSVNSSQDGVVVSGGGQSPWLMAGHGNCPKVAVVFETD